MCVSVCVRACIVRARARTHARCGVVCSVFCIQNKLCRFETQIRREVPSRETFGETTLWNFFVVESNGKIVIHVYRGCSSSRGPFPGLEKLCSAFHSSCYELPCLPLRRSRRSRDKSAASSNNIVIRLRSSADLTIGAFYKHWVGV